MTDIGRHIISCTYPATMLAMQIEDPTATPASCPICQITTFQGNRLALQGGKKIEHSSVCWHNFTAFVSMVTAVAMNIKIKVNTTSMTSA